MEKIRLLDCTLRDGGYINGWDFGEKTIMKQILPEEHGRTGFVVMALHDQYDVRKLEENDGTVSAVRVTFHDYDVEEGLTFCRRVMEKGYPLFVNPINIMGYEDGELLRLLEKVNRLGPDGFSIVDTFGSMTKKELIRIYSLCENNLEEGITLGLHLHENMAQSFLLAQSFLEMRAQERNCVVDASGGIWRSTSCRQSLMCTGIMPSIFCQKDALRQKTCIGSCRRSRRRKRAPTMKSISLHCAGSTEAVLQSETSPGRRKCR